MPYRLNGHDTRKLANPDRRASVPRHRYSTSYFGSSNWFLDMPREGTSVRCTMTTTKTSDVRLNASVLSVYTRRDAWGTVFSPDQGCVPQGLPSPGLLLEMCRDSRCNAGRSPRYGLFRHKLGFASEASLTIGLCSDGKWLTLNEFSLPNVRNAYFGIPVSPHQLWEVSTRINEDGSVDIREGTSLPAVTAAFNAWADSQPQRSDGGIFIAFDRGSIIPKSGIPHRLVRCGLK